ncbi:MAG: LptF/LptG family permease [Candidatus Eremiobacteraeota bacterium]|nr:LptF/LptG family permease [Candidatus Eremiobacteraeota bacterium]
MPRVSILDRYLVSAMIPPFLFGIAAFLIFWAFNIFFIASDFIINQHAPVLLVLRFVIYRMPQCTPMAFPFASLLAGLWSMGQFVGNNEITAMRAAGISVWRIALGPILFGVAAAVACYFINESIAPQAVDISTRSFYQIVYHADTLPAEQQIFRKDTATETVYYVTQVMPDNATLEGVQIFKAARMQTWSETLQAKSATLQDGFMTLHEPVVSRYNANGDVTKQRTGKDVTVPLPAGETAKEFLSSVNSDSWTMSSARLRQQIDALQSQGIGGTALGVLRVNLANKTAWPFACIVGIFLSVPLAIRFGNRGRFAGIGLSIFALFIYYLMVSAASSFGRTGFIDATLSCWLPNIIITVTTLGLMWQEEPLITTRPRLVALRQPPRPAEQ